MTKSEFLKLSDKFMVGKCTPEEVARLREYDDWITLQDDNWNGEMGEKDAVYKQIHDRLSREIGYKHQSKNNYTWLKIAAVLLLIVSAALLFYPSKPIVGKQQPIANSAIKTHIVPGKQQATLTLSNGERIALNTLGSKSILTEQGASIIKSGNGLIYDIGKSVFNRNELSNKFNTISTPAGGEYHLILSDGTGVWLNAGSSLKFPVNFAKNQRVVEITGEGYFEVKKDPGRPFLVNAGTTQVKVLGTHFNVSAYANDKYITTTLLEGAVQLHKGTVSTLLKPGQQGISTAENTSISVRQADLESVIAWTKGRFVFNDINIKDVMKIVERWYDVDVEYEGNVGNKKFGGTTSRYDNITELLNNMALTGGIHYKIEGRKVTISN